MPRRFEPKLQPLKIRVGDRAKHQRSNPCNHTGLDNYKQSRFPSQPYTLNGRRVWAVVAQILPTDFCPQPTLATGPSQEAIFREKPTLATCPSQEAIFQEKPTLATSPSQEAIFQEKPTLATCPSQEAIFPRKTHTCNLPVLRGDFPRKTHTCNHAVARDTRLEGSVNLRTL